MHIRHTAYMRAVKRCTVKYAVIESDVPLLLLRDFFLGGGFGMKIGCWLRENLRKMRCFFRWGHWIVRYIVEEGRRERAGGGGEEQKKGTLVSLFLLCVFWFVEEGESTPTYITWI